MVIQAKFRVDDPGTFLHLQIVDNLAGFGLQTSQFEEVHDTYLDTRSKRLFEAGYRFRRREQSDGLLMTLATLSKPAGAIHRWEKWEILLASDRRLGKWPDSPIRTKMLELIEKEHLAPLVKFQQTRIIRRLLRGKQQIAEVRLDSVDQKIGVQQQVHFEMEVELIPPNGEGTLIEIVKYLEKEWDVWPERDTKFELAYAAITATAFDWPNQSLFGSAYRLRRSY